MELLTITAVRAKFEDPGPAMIFFLILLGCWVISIIVSYLIKCAITFALVPGLSGTFTILLGGAVGQLTLNTL